MVHDLTYLRSHNGVSDRGFATFVGDDSIIATFKPLNTDLSPFFAHLFNLEVKANYFKYPSFCSKFIVRAGDRYVLIPDVIKLVTKLGRRDLVNREHVEDYRISLVDNLASLNDERVYDDLDAALNERYRTCGCHYEIYRTLVSLAKNKARFQGLFSPGTNMCLDPSRRSVATM